MRVFQPQPRKGKLLPWYVEFVDEARQPIRKRLSLRTLDHDSALARASELEKQWAAGDFDPWTGRKVEKGMKLSDAIELVCEQRYRRLAESTYQQRRYILMELFGKVAGLDKGLRTISSHHVRSFLSKYDGHTYNTFFGQLRTFFNDCQRLGAIKHNPFDQMIKPRGRYPVQLRVVTPEEYRALVEGITNPWLNTTVQVAYFTGMRHGEIRHLRWEHVHFDRGLIEVKNTKWFSTKNKQDRTVPMPKALGRLLTEWKERHLDHVWPDYRKPDQKEWVMINRTGGVPDRHSTVVSFHVNVKKLGLSPELTLHKFRHTYASNMVRAGTPLEVLKEILGHASIQTTLIYAHFQVEDLQNWVNRVFET